MSAGEHDLEWVDAHLESAYEDANGGDVDTAREVDDDADEDEGDPDDPFWVPEHARGEWMTRTEEDRAAFEDDVRADLGAMCAEGTCACLPSTNHGLY